jgi:protein-tyrosine kinase
MVTPSINSIPTSREANIGRILLESGKITPEQAERILRVQKERGIRFGEAAQSLGFIKEQDIQQVLSCQFEYPYLQPGQGKYPSELVAAYHPFSHQVEVLRAIRSQLMLRWFTNGHRALAVTSNDSGTGTSFFIANLAVVFSQLGEKTLLIDANLRSQRQHSIFNITTKQGLSDILAGRSNVETISKVEAFSDLFVLAAGTPAPNPQELVSRSVFKELLDTLSSQYDVILIDTPACSVGADALNISALAGGVLFTARKHKTRLEDLEAIGDQISFAGTTTIVGSVLLDF